MASEIGNISKFTKELDIFTNWTVDGTQYTFHENWLYVVAKFFKPQDFKTTFQNILTCIFLSLRANFIKTQFAMTRKTSSVKYM